MRKFLWVVLAAALLSGCGSQPVLETVADTLDQPAMAPAREIRVTLPEEAAVPAVEGGSGRLYLCRDYEIAIQTLPGGDLETTIQTLSGYESRDLTVLETHPQGLSRYDFVWACTGETGPTLGRAVILDDGNYHYTMTVLRDADTARKSQVVWSNVFSSFSLA